MDQNLLMSLLLAAAIGVMFVVMTISQKKKNKKEQEIRNSVKVGDEITTIGGIVCTVVGVKDDEIVVESQSGRFKLMKWAIATMNKS